MRRITEEVKRKHIPMKLVLKETAEGYELVLDDKKLRYVEEYQIIKSSAKVGIAELTLKMMVQYP